MGFPALPLPPPGPADLPRLLGHAESIVAELSLPARRILPKNGFGRHGQRRAGSGFDFFETRPMRAGDSPRLIDYKSSARSAQDDMLVRIPENDMPQTLWLWCDASASMRWKSAAQLPGKQECALLLATAIARIMALNGERVGMLSPGGQSFAGAAAPYHFLRSALDQKNPPLYPQAGGRMLRGIAMIVGDFLSPAENWKNALTRLAQSGIGACLIHVIDPAERDPSQIWRQGRIELEGTEGEAPLLLGDGVSALSAYRRAWEIHEQGLIALARQLRFPLVQHITGESPAACLEKLSARLKIYSAGAPP